MLDSFEPHDPWADNPDAILSDVLDAAGWSTFFDLGDEDSPIFIESWRRTTDDGDEYLIQVSDVSQGSPLFKTTSFMALMDLFARWAPVVQAAALVDLIKDLNGTSLNPGGMGMVEAVAARAAYGLSDVLPAMRGREREARVARERLRAARRVEQGGSQ